MRKKTGGPAFPRAPSEQEGMTLRDYFAAKALQGMLALGTDTTVDEADDTGFSVLAYQYADATLKARAA